jgi:signal peptidase II
MVSRLLLLVAIVATIGCDQVTKRMASASLAGTSGRSYLAGTVRMTYVENAGGFLGMGDELPPVLRTVVFTGATGLMLLVMTVVAVRERMRGLALLGVTLFVAGGASNWADRVANGRVVDFLNVGIGPVRTGIFNVADVALMAGAFMFLVAELTNYWRTHEPD